VVYKESHYTPEEELSIWESWANTIAVEQPEFAESIVLDIIADKQTVDSAGQQGPTTVE
jgi:hypothetical protein